MACPTFGGTLKSVDDAPALAIRGVQKVLSPDNAVIVVAEGYWQAKKGLAALSPERDAGINAARNDETYRTELLAALEAPAPVAHAEGDTEWVGDLVAGLTWTLPCRPYWRRR